LRAGLRRKEKNFFDPYPALAPSARKRASKTHWANLVTRLTALTIVILCGMALLERYADEAPMLMSPCLISQRECK
jgi:ADP-heptose:LPS heptosyltransferase